MAPAASTHECRFPVHEALVTKTCFPGMDGAGRSDPVPEATSVQINRPLALQLTAIQDVHAKEPAPTWDIRTPSEGVGSVDDQSLHGAGAEESSEPSLAVAVQICPPSATGCPASSLRSG